MGNQDFGRVDRVHGNDGIRGPRTPSSDPTEFRRLLEQLESLAATRAADTSTPGGDDVVALQEALREADAEYAQVMDLRSRLENAFRRATS